MSEQEQTLTKLPDDYAKYEKKLKLCINFLFKGLSAKEMDEKIGKVRFEFMFHLNLNNYYDSPTTPEDALRRSIRAIAKDQNLSERAVNECCFSKTIFRNFLGAISHMTRKTA